MREGVDVVTKDGWARRFARCATLIEQADGVLNAYQMQRLDGCMGDV